MKRDFLRELGLEKEAIDAIMAQNGADIEHAKDILSTKIEQLEAQLKEANLKLTDATKKSGDTEALTKRVAELEEQKNRTVEEHSKELTELRIKHALESQLMSAKVKNVKAAAALIDMDKIKLGTDGVEGISAQIKALQESEDTKFLFESSAGIKGVSPGESNTKTNASPQLSFRDAISKALRKD